VVFEPAFADPSSEVACYGERRLRQAGKKRGQRAKAEPEVAVAEPQKSGEKPLASGGKQGRKRWAALIKQVYEVDPLCCPKCGAEMKTCPAVALAKVDLSSRSLGEGGPVQP